MELMHLYELLVEAFDAVEANKTYRALFKLNRIIALIEPVRTDYADIEDMYCWIYPILWNYWNKKWNKEIALTNLDMAITLCESWIECKRSA